MSFSKKAEELAFNKRYSRFKVQIYFPRRMAITHYGQERYGCTVAQINWKHVKQVTLDRERGLQDCLDRIALCEKRHGPYQVALIFDRNKILTKPDGTRERGREIMKYAIGVLVESDPVIFSTPKEKRVLCTVKHTGTGWDLIPVEDPVLPSIDFKKEIAASLATPVPKIHNQNLNQQSK